MVPFTCWDFIFVKFWINLKIPQQKERIGCNKRRKGNASQQINVSTFCISGFWSLPAKHIGAYCISNVQLGMLRRKKSWNRQPAIICRSLVIVCIPLTQATKKNRNINVYAKEFYLYCLTLPDTIKTDLFYEIIGMFSSPADFVKLSKHTMHTDSQFPMINKTKNVLSFFPLLRIRNKKKNSFR